MAGRGSAGLGSVYPRECGGTFAVAAAVLSAAGLSPRVRGNHGARQPRHRDRGSIPASAGEPALHHPARRAGGVYPRECGGTAKATSAQPPTSGLSPRVRGNQATGRERRFHQGSIPASAGEPPGGSRLARCSGVYPRECGGTELIIGTTVSRLGLSPRVRGNRFAAPDRVDGAGSIPASAGEPDEFGVGLFHGGVYPRECGGTCGGACLQIGRSGLSPRVRGNHLAGVRKRLVGGSIPASAGEPRTHQRHRGRQRVYPRECGGTAGSARSGSRR